mmetsp:Transcript_32014/g.76081  ORF Transcript_32014/g.76081 Transcript_32014/m.76081 type:complete len:244 (-) Transcript_32014:537-1268(-)
MCDGLYRLAHTPSETKDSVAKLYKMAFGSSSESEDDSEFVKETFQNTLQPRILEYETVPGLCQIKQFLSRDCQRDVVQAVRKLGWLNDPDAQNQAMVFGTLPSWLTPVLVQLERFLPCVWPKELVQRQPLFNQMILNLYTAGQGICSHVDLARFEDGIANVSFLSSCVMKFQKACCKNETPSESTVPVLLEPGDLLLLQGEARYNWTHGIDAVTEEVWDGRVVARELRMSITLRRLCQVCSRT